MYFTLQPFNHSEFLPCGLPVLVSATCILFNYISTNPHSFRSSSAVIVMLGEVTESVRAAVSGQSVFLQCLRQSKVSCSTEFLQAGLRVCAGRTCPGQGSDAWAAAPARSAGDLHVHRLLIAISCTHS